MSHIYENGIDAAIRKLENPQRVSRHDPNVLFSRIGLESGMVVADLGCGTGFFALPASKIVGAEGMVYAIDQMPEALDVLRRKIEQGQIGNIKVFQSDIHSTPIESGSVDLALMANVFHDADRKVVLNECRRILKSSGKLFIIDWKKISTVDGPPLQFRIEQADARDIIQNNGWKVISSFEAGPAHYAITASKME